MGKYHIDNHRRKMLGESDFPLGVFDGGELGSTGWTG